ncbi:MAG: site-specific integrase [Dehalococcoidia bacterium]|nr:site-specific integrase [Dehalococcoidia bacterium]
MRGYVHERPSQDPKEKTWELQVDIGRDPKTGRRRRVSETVHGSHRAAQARLAELLVEVENQRHKKPAKNVTVAEYLDHWISNYVELRCAPRTVESYQYVARKLVAPEIGAVRLWDLTADHLQELYRTKLAQGLSRRTVRYCHSLMAQALTYAVRQEVLARNVADLADPPSLEHQERATLRLENTDAFLTAARDTPYYVVFYTMLHTGLRRGEALALRWGNVDLGLPNLGVAASVTVTASLTKVAGALVLREPKTAAGRRRVPLTPSCALVLRQHRDEQQKLRTSLRSSLAADDFVFTRPEGGPLDPSTVSKAFGAILRKARLPKMPLHGLRHTHATHLLTSGVHPKVVQERLGHASIRETMDTYSHTVPGLQEAAAKKFDDLLAGSQSGDVSKMSANPATDDGERR